MKGQVIQRVHQERFVRFGPLGDSGDELELRVPKEWEWLLPTLAASIEMEQIIRAMARDGDPEAQEIVSRIDLEEKVHGSDG